MIRILLSALLLTSAEVVLAGDASVPDYETQVAPLFAKYCTGCHNDGDREGEFSLETYASLQKGSPRGAVLKPGDAAASRMIRQLTGKAKPAMPPKGEPRPRAEEIALLKAWIDGGAAGPRPGKAPDRLALVVPRIASHATVRPVTALDVAPDGRWLAVARDATVALYHTTGGEGAGEDKPTRVLADFPGTVTAVHFTADGSRLVTASGVAGLGGVAALWTVADGSLVRRFPGHRDLLYDAELAPDGSVLATCSYDKAIELWDATTGAPLRTLSGHNGAVYDIAFSPDSRFLVSASADDTCKVWRVADGMRLDTLAQPLEEEYCCAFSPDGRLIAAGGADNTIRVWKFIAQDRPRINPMVQARFAHEGPIVRLAFTPDGARLVSVGEDRAIKLWETAGYTELEMWGEQPDVAVALAIAGDGRSFRVGRMDGSLAAYSLPGPQVQTAPAEPEAPAPAPAEVAAEGSSAPLNRLAEREPNNTPAEATAIDLPAELSGTIAGKDKSSGAADVDLYHFSARAGEPWVIEVNAARAKSKLDSFVEVLDAQGNKVPRVLLQAVRNSYFTFRGKDDSTADDFRVFNWEEMRLNEYLYSSGEVVKLWLYPRGPDSGFVVYPGEGKRWGYFDTTPLAHALGEPCYVVEPHPPGTELIPNGLPVFPLYFDNDDDARRALGKDSRLTFTAPADGVYLVKVKDVRGLAGADFKYTLTIRPSRPDFEVRLEGPKTLAVGPGSAREFTVQARRIDGYEGPIRVDIEGLPPGFAATTPVVIEAGQVEALGVVSAARDAAQPTPEQASASKLTASATIAGHKVSHPAGTLGALKLGEKPKLQVRIEPTTDGPRPTGGAAGEPLEFAIHPGQTITLRVKVERSGFAGQVPFGKEGAGRNLPFGVYVDNLGLNGLLVLEDQDERTFFITADESATSQTRAFHLTTTAAGGHSSPPVLLHVH
jgi:WD40 repeat protein